MWRVGCQVADVVRLANAASITQNNWKFNIAVQSILTNFDWYYKLI